MNKESVEFIDSVKKYKKILIIIQGSPDPDAIASSFAIMKILKYHSIDSEIVAFKKLSLSQNKAFVKLLGIPLKIVPQADVKNFDAYIITDFQNNNVKGVSEKLPCVAHIDHHQIDRNTIPSDFRLIRTDAGSTSTLITFIIRDFVSLFKDEDIIKVSTALMFGIQTDTDSYEYSSNIDIEAVNFLSEYADMSVINKINGIPLSHNTMSFYNKAISNKTEYKDWGFFGLGYMDSIYRDSIAIIADLLLKNTKLKLVAVYSLIFDSQRKELFLDVSIRTRNPDLDLNSMIKKITPTGGGRAFKGAYQIKLDYFRHFENSSDLWKVITETTIDWLKRSRDVVYLYEISGMARNIFQRAFYKLKK